MISGCTRTSAPFPMAMSTHGTHTVDKLVRDNWPELSTQGIHNLVNQAIEYMKTKYTKVKANDYTGYIRKDINLVLLYIHDLRRNGAEKQRVLITDHFNRGSMKRAYFKNMTRNGEKIRLSNRLKVRAENEKTAMDNMVMTDERIELEERAECAPNEFMFGKRLAVPEEKRNIAITGY